MAVTVRTAASFDHELNARYVHPLVVLVLDILSNPEP